jgi:hypothetical protein
MVAAVRRGASMRSVAEGFRVSLRTVQRWVERAAGRRLDRVAWSDQPDGPQQVPSRTPTELEDLVLSIRGELRHSDLGEFGALPIRDELLKRLPDPEQVPSVRTINRILSRRGVFDAQQRVRRKAPPRGWYLPEVVAGRAELDQFDVISGLHIKNGPEVEVLTVVSLHGGLVDAWPQQAVSAQSVRQAMEEHWRSCGLPCYVQFDNDTRFQGPHQHADVIGSVMRLSLSLGVVVVFAPVRESGFQAGIESFNGLWQAKVWVRFEHQSMVGLQQQSRGYVAASRARRAVRLEAAPTRAQFPAAWKLNLQAHPRGQVIFVRRTSESGTVELLGHSFAVDPQWPRRLVRAEVDLSAGCIRFYRLRRREPGEQPLVAEVPYKLPHRRFRE